MTALTAPPIPFDEHHIDRFGFGQNWLDYQSSIDQTRILAARTDIEQWLGTTSLDGLRVLDIGSGSGLHSYCMHAMGARELVSFDYDENSVRATKEFHAKAGAPSSWSVLHGSVLDGEFLARLGTFDLVYSWGVLHHTGQMWQAIRNASALVRPNGTLFISIYAKGPEYPDHLALKQRYHHASLSAKRRMEFEWIMERYELRARTGQVPSDWWTEGRERGMDSYCDLVDWLGGLPYEVATLRELTTALRELDITTTRSRECPGDGGCHILVGQRQSHVAIVGGTTSRAAWPHNAPVMWLGVLESADAPERVVPLARALPQTQFVMVATNYAQLDAESRRALNALSPNLHISDRPANDADLLQQIGSCGVLLHTADGGPSPAWMTMAAAVGAPVVCVWPDAAREISERGMGCVGDGDLSALASGLIALLGDAALYARTSAAVSKAVTVSLSGSSVPEHCSQ
jgi:2-polyprenyl-3-methyl-5-hydroxy-6-metoxy-1,4-benzoquinol methylase